MVEPMKKWKIVSDGTSHGTKIISPSGEALGMVQNMQLYFNCNEEFVKGVLTIILPTFEVEVEESCLAVERKNAPKEV